MTQKKSAEYPSNYGQNQGEKPANEDNFSLF